MKTGLVIIHYNDYESLSNLIKNVSSYNFIDKIVIVDNNSDNCIKEKLKKFASLKIEIIENKENKGFAAAINIGCHYLIEKLKNCNIFISNCDVLIKDENDLKKLSFYLKDKNIGVVAPTIIENNNYNRGWKQPSPFIDAMMNLIYIHRFIRKKWILYNVNTYKNKTSIVDVVSGCFFLINSQTLQKIDFFDENTFLYYEENILAKKLSKENLQLIVCNDVFIIHNHSVSIDKNLKKIKKLKIQKKSQYYFQTQYNHANFYEKIFLKLTSFFSISLLTIYYFMKDLLKK